jgi:hypothetical protein
MPAIKRNQLSTPGDIVYRAGLACCAGGLIGVAQGVTLLVWSPQVPATQYSYPFDGVGFVVAQTSFFVQHLLLIVGVAALLGLSPLRASRIARGGIRAAVVGLALLAVTELVAISAYDVTTDSAHATVVNTLYGAPLVLIGCGLAVAGIAVLRNGTAAWRGARWLPAVVLLLGGYIVVLLIPGVMGSFTAGRLAISGWMFLFAVLGYGLTRLAHEDAELVPSKPTPVSRRRS